MEELCFRAFLRFILEVEPIFQKNRFYLKNKSKKSSEAKFFHYFTHESSPNKYGAGLLEPYQA
jgi:hypothetical protein